jgi:predicted HTH transcriptional regulator
MTPEDFAEYLRPGYEGQGYEFKGAFPRDDAVFFAKVTKAALGMVNRAGGGLIFIGIDELPEGGEPVLTGLNDLVRDSWNYDDIAAGFAPAADPRLTFDREVLVYEGKSFVVLTIHEFEDIPVLCAKDYNHGGVGILRKGALYVRSRGKPETTEVPTQTEMRAVLDLAIDKGVRAFLARSGRVGLHVPPAAEPDDAMKFADELAEPDA